MRAGVIVSLLAIGTAVLAESPTEEARRAVKVYLVKNESGGLNVQWAENIASRIFAGAGVRINCQFGQPKRGEQHSPIIIDLSSKTSETLAPGALAFAQGV